jgi:amyloid beta precursor protein binding protein 1
LNPSAHQSLFVTIAIVNSVRWNGCELHNIAACIGGAASQEALKLIVEQYVPLNNTMIFDGVFAKAAVFEL